MARYNQQGKNNPNYKHGMREIPEYNVWKGIIQRCFNPKNKDYKNYGGRGITVCDRWKNFVNFFEDMGTRPEDKTIDRIDNNGSYERSNCRWVTWAEQANNKRPCMVHKVYKNNKTGLAGISWHNRDKKYQVRKTIQGKRIYLGFFTTFDEAASALKNFNKEEVDAT